MRRAACIFGVLVACSDAPDEGASASSSSETTAIADTSTTIAATTTPVETTTTAPATIGDGSGDASESTGEPALGAPYPVVLVHGFFGFDELGDLDAATYFFGVVDRLAEDGELEVYTPALDPFNDSTVRGMQLVAHVEQILADTGHAKVNLVGHSQGGLDARVVASLRPELVATVTTIATPHHGTPIADIVLGIVPDPNAQALADALAQLLGAGLWSELDQNSSVAVALAQLSTPGITEFNETYPDADGVVYRSIAGRSALSAGGSDCIVDDAPAWISEFDDARDPVDAALALSAGVLAGDVLDPRANDGLVRVLDSRWGDFRGCVPADHLDEVGQLFGDGPGLGNPWDHLELYAALVAELRNDGY